MNAEDNVEDVAHFIIDCLTERYGKNITGEQVHFIRLGIGLCLASYLASIFDWADTPQKTDEAIDAALDSLDRLTQSIKYELKMKGFTNGRPN